MEVEKPISQVEVLSTDEERLKFRIIAGYSAAAGGAANPNRTATVGQFTINLPPLTSFGNSDHYNACVIKVDSFAAMPQAANVTGTWASNGNVIKTPGIILNMDIPSSQAISIDTTSGNAAGPLVGIGRITSNRFSQFLPMQVVNVGNTAAPFPAAAGGASWTAIGSGVSSTDPILSANPFGKDLTIQFKAPFSVNGQYDSTQNCYIAAAGAAAADVGSYVIQMTIEMVPNK
jgi:hypothetical protein